MNDLLGISGDEETVGLAGVLRTPTTQGLEPIE